MNKIANGLEAATLLRLDDHAELRRDRNERHRMAANLYERLGRAEQEVLERRRELGMMG